MSLPKIIQNASNGVAVLSRVTKGPGFSVNAGSEKDELFVVGIAVVDVFGHVSVSVCEWLVGCLSVTVTAETSGVCVVVIISVSSSSTDMNISAISNFSGTSSMFTCLQIHPVASTHHHHCLNSSNRCHHHLRFAPRQFSSIAIVVLLEYKVLVIF